jgi:uncharacterized membrane protein
MSAKDVRCRGRPANETTVAPNAGAGRPRSPARPYVRRNEERGQALLLLIGLAAILVVLIAVVADASHLYLYRRALASAADGAATAAVQALDEAAVYRDPDVLSRGALPLDASAARGAVQRYVQNAGIPSRFNAFSIQSVGLSPDRTAVTVTLSARVELPVPGVLLLRSVGEARIVVASTARAAVQ